MSVPTLHCIRRRLASASSPSYIQEKGVYCREFQCMRLQELPARPTSPYVGIVGDLLLHHVRRANNLVAVQERLLNRRFFHDELDR